MENTQTTSFLQLLSEYSITIPDIQRDYSQGRIDPEIDRIRRELVKNIHDSIVNKKELILNFIYGQIKNDEFKPIDGQQRLTTLFLFHIYLAHTTSDKTALEILKKFKYDTRETSSRFCTYLCELQNLNIDCESTVTAIIFDMPWFTGAFSCDPTIKSMLNMLDEIHYSFKNYDKTRLVEFYSCLSSEQCPVKFLWLNLEKFDDSAMEDLYIKMNARGKQLTDFEIFKGKLQKSDILKLYAQDILASEDQDEETSVAQLATECISKINNDFSEMFYSYSSQYLDQPLQKYDELMMAFFYEVIKYEYFLNLLEQEISLSNEQKRKEIIKFNNKTKTVSEIWEILSTKELQNITFKKIVSILDSLRTHFNIQENGIIIKNSDIPTKEYFNESLLLDTLNNSYSNNTLRYLSYYFLANNNKIDNNFFLYKRFISNIIVNASSGFDKNPDVAFRLVYTIIKNLEINSNNMTSEISKFNCNFSLYGMESQFSEEKTKSMLILESDDWKNLIWEAEEYFVDGQIDFILQLSKNTNEDISIVEFKRYLALAKVVFDNSKKLLVDSVLFRKALLLMDDITDSETSYLLKVDQAKSYSLGFESFKDSLSPFCDMSKRNVLLSLIKDIASRLSCETANRTDINQILEEIIKEKSSDTNDYSSWKDYFVNEPSLFESPWWNTSLKNIFFKENELVFLLTQKRTSSDNYDIKTYYLAFKNNLLENLKYTNTEKLKDDKEFLRHLDLGNKKRIAYDYENATWVLSERKNIWNAISEQEVNELIKSL